MSRMLAAADDAGSPLNALANRTRLVIICQLTKHEGSVGELAAPCRERRGSRPVWPAPRSNAIVKLRRIDASHVVVVLVVRHAGHEQNDRGIAQILPPG